MGYPTVLFEIGLPTNSIYRGEESDELLFHEYSSVSLGFRSIYGFPNFRVFAELEKQSDDCKTEATGKTQTRKEKTRAQVGPRAQPAGFWKCRLGNVGSLSWGGRRANAEGDGFGSRRLFSDREGGGTLLPSLTTIIQPGWDGTYLTVWTQVEDKAAASRRLTAYTYTGWSGRLIQLYLGESELMQERGVCAWVT